MLGIDHEMLGQEVEVPLAKAVIKLRIEIVGQPAEALAARGVQTR